MRVADVSPGASVAGRFIVATAETRTTRNGDPFLRLNLRDAEGGTIDAIYFGVSETTAREVTPGRTYEIKGRGDEWQGRTNLKISAMRIADEQLDAAALLPRSSAPPESLRGAIDTAIEGLGNEQIKSVLEAVMAAEPVADRLSEWPAAKARHHAWLGGLAEHTGEMLGLAAAVADVFPTLDRDLLTAGVILHDLGKLIELDIAADIAYTAAGNLEGHMVHGVRILDDALRRTACDDETAMLLRHMILSHQGTREFAAVVEPMFPEAIALHYIDQLSSQVRPALDDVAEVRGRGTRATTFRGQRTRRMLYVRGEEPPGGDHAGAEADLPF